MTEASSSHRAYRAYKHLFAQTVKATKSGVAAAEWPVEYLSFMVL